MLTISTHDAAVQTALPMLFGKWTLKEKRVARPLWGRKQVTHAGVLGTEDGGGGSSSFEVLLLPKGRLEQPLDSALRGLDWRLIFQVRFFVYVACMCVAPHVQPTHPPTDLISTIHPQQDIYATGRLEFKIVHPPPEKKLVANDQLPSIHYYSGVFCEGLDRVEGTIERYSDIEDEKLGPIRKKVCIGQFCLKKKKEDE